MATIKLKPSVLYNAAGTTYLTITNQDNAFTDTSSSTYAQVDNINASTSNRYVYLRGFDFSSIGDDWEINSFTVRLKASESGISTSTSYRPRLCNNTTTITGSSNTIGTSASTIEFTSVTTTWSTIKNYGSDFGIRINVRRASSNTSGYVQIYGAEIEVNYTAPDPRTITSTLSGNGTIDPSGAQTYYDDDEYLLKIYPTSSSDPITVTNNGVDVSSEVEPPESLTDTEEQVLGTYTLTSGGFNGSGASYFQGLVGKGYNNSSQTTTNYYSSGNGTIAVFTYDMHVNIPNDATVTACYFMVNGHAESTSQSSEYMCAQLYAGSTAISNELNFKSIGTSNSTQTIQATTLPTPAQCATLKLQCRLGYYGGAINGATVFVTYSVTRDYYSYTYTVSGDATIAVTIGTPGPSTQILYYKSNGSWVAAATVYKKVSGSWVQQADLTSVFDANTNYVKG